MNLSQAKNEWSAHKKRRRIGRGESSGWGKTAGRGANGQKSRTGASIKMTFAGGTTSLFRRIPKIGFTNKRYMKLFRTINVSALEIFDNGTEVTAEMLLAKGIIKKGEARLKVLGNGDLTKKLTVVAAKFTEGALSKIEAAGGTTKVQG